MAAPRRAVPVLLAAAALLRAPPCEGSRAASGARRPIWFASWQHAGHIKALCPVALELQARGHAVRVAVHDEVRDRLPAGLPAVGLGPLPWSWDEELQYRRTLWDPLAPAPAGQEETPDQASTRKAEVSEQYFLGSQRSLALGLREALRALPREEWPSLVVADVSSVGAMDVAESLDLPYAVISPWPVGPTLQSIADPSALAHPWLPSELFAFAQSAGQQGLVDRLKRVLYVTLLPRFMALAGFHEPRRRLRAELGLAGALELLEAPVWGPRNEKPLVLVLSHWGFDRPRPLPPNLLLVGPVENYTARMVGREGLPGPVAAFLRHPRVIYVSFGTNVEPRPRTTRALLEGMELLEPAGFRFLWDAAQADVEARAATAEASPGGPAGTREGGARGEAGEAAPGHELAAEEVRVPGNVLFAPRVDQLAVLASGRVAAFVSHCGLNSVHEAMHFGVPVVGLPFLGDQLISAHLLEEAGAGRRLEVAGLSGARVEAAVRAVAAEARHGAAARRVGGLARGAGGARAAAEALEAVAEHGAGHLQTIADLHPAAARLWDVRAVLASASAGLALLLWLLLRGDPRAAPERGKRD